MKETESEIQELSLFDLSEEKSADKSTGNKLEAVEADFKCVHKVVWEDLFSGFDEMYAITYSSGIDFISRVLPNFKNAEIIFGCEAVLDDSVAMVMSVQLSQLKFVTKHKSADMLAQRLDNETLKLYVSRAIKSHEKIYLLKSYDGRVRVITGSANLSYSAFNGIQRENITYMDNISAYEYYYEQFERFKMECADNVEHKCITKLIAKPDSSVDELLDSLPISATIKARKAVILSETEEPEYVIAVDADKISKEIKPLIPKKDKKGQIALSPEVLSNVKRRLKIERTEREEKLTVMPKLRVDAEKKLLSFNNKECDLHPERSSIESDIRCYIEYMDGFDAFSGNVENNKKMYFLFTNWFLASPFMPYLRFQANKYGQDIKQFPVYAMLYGESNGGKTEFTKLLSKMMSGKNVTINKNGAFNNSTIDPLKQSCEGVPIIIDDLSKQQYQNNISNIVKYDEWGLKENLLYYPSVVMTTNEIPSVKNDISKRVFICHIDSSLDKEKGRANYKKIANCEKHMSNSFYCEYVRRMFDRIEKMVDDMMGSDDSYLPDIFAESSETIIEILKETLGDDLPEYIMLCTYSDYFGNKAVGRNAINKIQRAWYYEPEAFTVNKKRGILEYRIPDNTGTYILEQIRQELPPSLNAQVVSRTMTMNLDAACEFFGLDFKMNFWGRLHRRK